VGQRKGEDAQPATGSGAAASSYRLFHRERDKAVRVMYMIKKASLMEEPPGRRSGWIAGLPILVCLAGLLVMPAMAGERFVSGSPNLSVAILGTNEFSPGSHVMIPVIIQNSGLIEYQFSYPALINRIDLPNTAKLMIVTLGAGDAPVTIKSDPQYVGDLLGGSKLVANFGVAIPSDASAGIYYLPITIRYTYLYEADQYSTDVIQYFYKDESVNLKVPVRIKPEVILGVTSAGTEFVNAGTEGYLNIGLKNIGNERGNETVVLLSQVGNSPIVPVASSLYIGDLPMDSVVPVRYKIAVSRDAEAFTYPVNVSVQYKDTDGDIVASDPVTIGVPVGGKISFRAISAPDNLVPGSRQTWDVVYQNTGTGTAYSAEARIITVDPFTSNDDTSYLGDMAPGDQRTARFIVTVNSAATTKDYGLDSEVRFRDSLDNDQVSDRIKVPVAVKSISGIAAILTNPYFILVVVLVIAGAGYLVLSRRRKGPG
jgi:hypothetical protein